MGVAIRYCDKCRTRISPGDLESGKAIELEEMVFCPDCAKNFQSAPGTSEGKKKSSPPRLKKTRRSTRRGANPLADSNLFNPFQVSSEDSGTSRPTRTSPPRKPHPRKPTTTVMKRRAPSGRAPQAEAKKSVSPLVIGGLVAGAVLVAVIVGVVFFAGRSDEPKKHERERDSSRASAKKSGRSKSVGKKTETDPKLKEAAKAYRKAGHFQGEHQDDWSAVREKLEEALEVCAGTKFEEKLRRKIEEGDREADAAGERLFRRYQLEVRQLQASCDFDRAKMLIREFKANQDWMEKAMDVHSDLMDRMRIWTLARAIPTGTKMTKHNIAAQMSLLAESAFGLEPALEGETLTGWDRSGAGSWTAKKGILTGKTEGGQAGEMTFGESTWEDYAVGFEFQIVKGKIFYLLVHADENCNAISIPPSGKQLEAGVWYQLQAVVWGDFAFLACHARERSTFTLNTRATSRSIRGGFGFRLAENTEIRFREIGYRRLSMPGQPRVPLPSIEYPVYRAGKGIPGISAVRQQGDTGGWSFKDGVIKGWSNLGDLFLLYGSPSWTEFEFKFEFRNLQKGMVFEVHRPVHARGLVDGKYEQAACELSAAMLGGSAWREGRLEAKEKELELFAGGKLVVKAPFSPMTTDKIWKPIRFGFRAGAHNGGGVEMRNLRILVTERGGGF